MRMIISSKNVAGTQMAIKNLRVRGYIGNTQKELFTKCTNGFPEIPYNAIIRRFDIKEEIAQDALIRRSHLINMDKTSVCCAEWGIEEQKGQLDEHMRNIKITGPCQALGKLIYIVTETTVGNHFKGIISLKMKTKAQMDSQLTSTNLADIRKNYAGPWYDVR
jgi:hypothetical protein